MQRLAADAHVADLRRNAAARGTLSAEAPRGNVHCRARMTSRCRLPILCGSSDGRSACISSVQEKARPVTHLQACQSSKRIAVVL